MKKLITLALACVALASCSKENEEGSEPNAPVEIKLNAGIGNIEAIGRAAVSSLPTEGLNVFFAKATDAATASWGDAEAIYAKLDGSGKVSFYKEEARTNEDPQYYNSNTTLKSHLIGYHVGDATSSLTGGKVSLTIDGSNDIMATDALSGDKDTPFELFTFNHLLSQLIFQVKCADGIPADKVKEIFGTVTKIEVLDQPTNIELTLGATQSISTATTAGSANFTTSTVNVEITSTETSIGDAIMVYTNQNLGKTASPIKLKVYTSTYSAGLEVSALINSGNDGLELGKKHTITLSFSLTAVSPTAAISAWGNATNNGTGEIK